MHAKNCPPGRSKNLKSTSYLRCDSPGDFQNFEFEEHHEYCQYSKLLLRMSVVTMRACLIKNEVKKSALCKICIINNLNKEHFETKQSA
jgi:hypothetical protein